MENILICPDTHLSPDEMYLEGTSSWIPFLKVFRDNSIVEAPSILQTKLQNRRIPGIYLGLSEDQMGDASIF
jgi:hypothetical protein